MIVERLIVQKDWRRQKKYSKKEMLGASYGME